MSDKIAGFRGKSIARVQQDCFLRKLPAARGRFRYASTGLNASAGTLVLFQFKARVIASARLIRHERFPKPLGGHAGVLHFDAASICTFEPMDIEMLRGIWPAVRPLGHVKQALSPMHYGKFMRRRRPMGKPS